MASRLAADPRRWTNFWSTIAADGTRYRHQVKLHRRLQVWEVRTEVWPDDQDQPYYTRDVQVPEDHGKHLFELRKTWTNVDPEDGPMYPPGYEVTGFLRLKGSEHGPTP
jgi:hypothetical protein